MLDPQLLQLLACPACGEDVIYKDSKVVCIGCQRKYPIKDGIPILMVSEADLPVVSKQSASNQKNNAL